MKPSRARVRSSRPKESRETLGLEYVPLAQLKRWPRNPKQHALDGIAGSIAEFGMRDPLAVNRKTGEIEEGHGRVDALQAMKAQGKTPPRFVALDDHGAWHVPVLYFEDDRKTQERYGLAHNRTQELGGGYDEPALARVLADLAADQGLTGTGWDADDVDDLLRRVAAEAAGPEDPGPQLDRAVALQKQWKVKRGQLWEIGKHRLLCGDATVPAEVERLMNGEKARLFATDPPYGVDYSKTKDGIPGSGFVNHQELWGDMHNDGLEGSKLQAFLETAFRACLPHLDRAAWYLWHAHLTQGFFAAAAAAAAADVLLHRQIIWKKPGFVLTRSGMYHWAHEPCFYGWVRGAKPAWLGNKSQTSVWELGRDDDSGLGPTQKPAEVFGIPMRNHLRRGEIALDPFLGAGTQIVAAEQTERLCYAMEISEPMVAVALERLSGMGLKPRLAK